MRLAGSQLIWIGQMLSLGICVYSKFLGCSANQSFAKKSIFYKCSDMIFLRQLLKICTIWYILKESFLPFRSLFINWWYFLPLAGLLNSTRTTDPSLQLQSFANRLFLLPFQVTQYSSCQCNPVAQLFLYSCLGWELILEVSWKVLEFGNCLLKMEPLSLVEMVL